MAKRYRVTLTDDERERLEGLTRKGEVLPVVKTGIGSKDVKTGSGGRPLLVGGSRSKPVEPVD